jgi:peptidyl-prolyl cis-trans isomerase SDCCAG10
MAFQKKLSSAKPETKETEMKEQKHCKLHDIPNCASCFDNTEEAVKETDDGWISHQLVFDKDLKGKDLMQRKETVDDYVVIDPRDREAKAKQEEYERKRGIKSKVGPAFRKREREDDDDRGSSSRKYNDSSSRRREDYGRRDDSRRDDYRRSSDRYDDDSSRRSRHV